MISKEEALSLISTLKNPTSGPYLFREEFLRRVPFFEIENCCEEDRTSGELLFAEWDDNFVCGLQHGMIFALALAFDLNLKEAGA